MGLYNKFYKSFYNNFIEKSVLFKIFISVISFIVITLLVYYYHCDLQNEKEQMMNKDVQQFTETFLEFSKSKEEKEKQKKEEETYYKDDGFIIHPYTITRSKSTYAPLEEGFDMPHFPSINDIGDTITNALKKPFEPVIDFIDNVKFTFEEIGKRVELLKTAFNEIGDAIRLEFVNLGNTIKTELEDVGNIANGGIKCGIYFVTNLRNCLIYYIIDFITQLIYSFFIRFPIWLLETLVGIDLTEIIQTINDVINQIDKTIFDLVGFSVFHFPQSVMEKCYMCQGVDFNELINKITVDNTQTFPRWMNEPTQKFNEAGTDFVNVFRPIKDPPVRIHEDNTPKSGGSGNEDDILNTAKGLGNKIINTGIQFGNQIQDAGKDAGNKIEDAGKDAGNKIEDAGKDAGNKIENVGRDIGRDIGNVFHF